MLSIGEVARRSGHSSSTLRYWEAMAILPAPPRQGGKRRYPPSVVDRIAVIDLARRAGLSLGDIRGLMEGVLSGQTAASQWPDLVEHKLTEVDAVIAHAQEVRRVLVALGRCQCLTLEECAALAARATAVPRDHQL